MYHRITTQCTTEHASYIFHSCGNFCGTRLVQQGYHTNTTGHLCTTGLPHKLPQSLCGIFFIPVVISVVLTCTTGIPQGSSVKLDVHFGHFQGLDFYCQWGHLGFKVCMMCRGTSTIITLIIRVTPCFILEKCVKNTMVLDVRARNDFFRLSCSGSKLCDV